VERLAKVRFDLQTINTQLETNNKTAQNSLHALERTNVSYKVKLQLVETQANAGRNQEARLQTKIEVLGSELARQKNIVGQCAAD